MKKSSDSSAKDTVDLQFETLLEYLKSTRGFDFTGYKRSSLMRRVRKRMAQIMINEFSDYLDYLEVHPDEFGELFNTILINVTGFFRDEEAWKFIDSEIIPQLLINSNDSDPIRIWCAGCASGQEAYSVAMMLCEKLGAAKFHERVKIYATDVDEHALSQARSAAYRDQDLECVSEDLQKKYFARVNEHLVFNPEMRRSVIFGRHDLVQDAPISRLDLLLCRNTLMYLNADTQARILARFHFGLKDNGYLFLGKAEMLLSHGHMFQQIGVLHRIFSKVSKASLRERLLVMAAAERVDDAETTVGHKLKELSFNTSVLAQIVLDRNGAVVASNDRARENFGLSASDIGKRFQDLEVSYRPIELRSCIQTAHNESRVVKIPGVEHVLPSGDIVYLDIEVCPLFAPASSRQLGMSITFNDRSNFRRLYDTLQVAHQELETTNEELQSTNEELETTNEELHSTNEELETTNEELQSANEELETTNEELQSTSEELEHTNAELRAAATEAVHNSSFLQAILSGMSSAIAVIDLERRILIWSERCEELWGRSAEEVANQDFLSLDIGLPVNALRDLIAAAQHSPCHETVELSARNRRGKKFQCKVRLSPLLQSSKFEGLVIQMDGIPSAEC